MAKTKQFARNSNLTLAIVVVSAVVGYNVGINLVLHHNGRGREAGLLGEGEALELQTKVREDFTEKAPKTLDYSKWAPKHNKKHEIGTMVQRSTCDFKNLC